MQTSELSLAQTSAGFLLLDMAMNLLLVNRTAVEILCYPKRPDAVNGTLESFLAAKIRSTLASRAGLHGSPIVGEFRSGRRLYFCRTFLVDRRVRDKDEVTIATLLERGVPGSAPLLQAASDKFHLTQRERKVLEYLLEGLTSKEIGQRMAISTNTVKAFLRLIMIKMGASTRAGIVGKAIRSNF